MIKSVNDVHDIRITLYCEYYRLWGGIFFRGAEMGFLTAFKNQMKILTREGISWTEDLSKPCDIFQANAQGLRTLWLIKKMKRRGVPTIVYAHATAEEWEGGFRILHMFAGLYKKFLVYLYNTADMVICVSEYNKDIMHTRYGVPLERLIFISNGVDADAFVFNEVKRKQFRSEQHIGDDEIVVINVAMVLVKKGLNTFISLAQKFQNLRFIWYGKIFKTAAEKIPTHPTNCVFYGFAPDIVSAYSAGDIFIFPSYEENQGISVLEAGARGLPIIVRDIPVYYGWLKDNENCLKARTDEEFQEKLLLLVADMGLRQRLGETSKKMVFEDHSLSAVGSKLKKLYTKLLER